MELKVAENQEEAWKIQEKFDALTKAWIQWKASEVFVDFSCKCGYGNCFNATFFYSVQCPDCKTIYHVNPNIELIEVKHHDGGSLVIPEDDEIVD